MRCIPAYKFSLSLQQCTSELLLDQLEATVRPFHGLPPPPSCCFRLAPRPVLHMMTLDAKASVQPFVAEHKFE